MRKTGTLRSAGARAFFPKMTPLSVHSRRLKTKLATPCPQESRAGSRSFFTAVRIKSTSLILQLERVFNVGLGLGSRFPAGLGPSSLPRESAGPVWVWEAFSRICSRFRPADFATRPQTFSQISAADRSGPW